MNSSDISGCQDHGCIIKKPKGMGTNASCRCSPRKVKKWTLLKSAEEIQNHTQMFNPDWSVDFKAGYEMAIDLLSKRLQDLAEGK